MKDRRKKHFSVENEPALTGRSSASKFTRKVAPEEARDEGELLRDSVVNEPHGDAAVGRVAFAEWIDAKRRSCTFEGNVAVTVLAALMGGPFAVVGALMSGQSGWWGVLYVCLMGPIAEELLKQSGMVMLLERRPWRLFSSWQFPLAAAVSALIFATLENVLYQHVYLAAAPNVERIMAFRWTWCTGLHVVCSVVASLGLLRVYRRVRDKNTPADLSRAFPWFVVAIAMHAAWNLGAVLLFDRLVERGIGG